MPSRAFLVSAFLLLLGSSVFAQELKPLSVQKVEDLLHGAVDSKRLSAIVDEYGVNFILTNSLREKFKRAGADAVVLAAVERATLKLKGRDKSDILKMAKNEGTVVWYTSLQSPLSEELCDRFNGKNPGITCIVRRSGSGHLYRRLVDEARSADNKADVFHTSNIADFVRLRSEGALSEYRPEGIENFDSSFWERDGHWAVLRAGLFVPAYNTRKIAANKLPNKWLDFFNEKFSGGGVAMGDPISSGYVNVGLAILANQFGWTFLDKLAAQKPQISLSAVEAMKQLRSGDAEMLFGGLSYSLYQEINNGAPIDYILPSEGVPFIASPQGILQNAPHPNAAIIFTDWLFSKEAQQLLADRGHYGGHRAVQYPKGQMPLKSLKLLRISESEASATYQRVRDSFREKF